GCRGVLREARARLDRRLMRLDGSVALVTGARSGIGEATSRALEDQGATVARVARRASVAADLTRRDQATAAVERVVAEHGRLDIVVNAAGVMLNGPIEDAPLEEWERMVELNML